MTDATISAGQQPAGTQDTLMPTLWQRAAELIEHLGSRRNDNDLPAWNETAMRLRTITLLAASIPAVTQSDIGRKAILAAFIRDTAGLEPSWSLAMIETAIAADMAALGPG